MVRGQSVKGQKLNTILLRQEPVEYWEFNPQLDRAKVKTSILSLYAKNQLNIRSVPEFD